ncbi:MAG: hypothetical protein DI540_11645 [Sphingobium sp.]|nr:MAG: hypothetical protein DI540_11645 [Sphingobium sp.]
MPTLGMLMGTHRSSDSYDENGESKFKSIFGPEGDKMHEDFVKRHVDPANRTAYHLRPGSEK